MGLLLLRVAVAAAGLVLCRVLPFFPGQYDSLAVTLSVAAQMMGMAGLVLVPIGALWLLFGRRGRTARGRRAFTAAAGIAGAFVWALGALGTAFSGSLTLGLLIAGGGIGAWAVRRRRPADGKAPHVGTLPLALIVGPVAVALLQWVLAGPAAEAARDRTIRNAAPLIADIERYHDQHGHYPQSMLSVWEDYRPRTVGIAAYQYEPSGADYNVAFELPPVRFGTREFVVYNPHGRAVMTSHDMDLLREPPERLAQQRGYYAARSTGHPNWTAFLFD